MDGKEIIGTGAYAVVYSDYSNEHGPVAIKRNLKDKKFDFCGTIREMHINNLFSSTDHPNIIQMLEVISKYCSFGDNSVPSHIPDDQIEDEYHYVYPLADFDLYKYIVSVKDDDGGVDYEIMKEITLDITLGLEFMHRNLYIHRDIKPENILLFYEDGSLTAKICDLGFTAKFNKYDEHTPKVITSWYRAPELMVNIREYDQKVDVWSLGCIIYEMITCKPLLNEVDPESNIKLFQNILYRLPYKVSDELFENFILNDPSLDNQIVNVSKCEDFKEFLMFKDDEFEQYTEDEDECGYLKDILMSMLSVDPKKRFNINAVLKHDFFDDYIDKIDRVTKSYSLNEVNMINKVYECEERNWAEDSCLIILLDRFEYDEDLFWFKNRALFQAISIFDRILLKLPEQKELHEDLVIKLKESDKLDIENLNDCEISVSYWENFPVFYSEVCSESGFVCHGVFKEDDLGTFFGEKDAQLFFYTILYFCVKYYWSTDVSLTFEDFYQFDDLEIEEKREITKRADYFEETVMTLLDHDFRKDTVYDIFSRRKKPEKIDIFSLSFFLFFGHHDGMTSKDACDFFIDNSDSYIKQAEQYLEELYNDDSGLNDSGLSNS